MATNEWKPADSPKKSVLNQLALNNGAVTLLHINADDPVGVFLFKYELTIRKLPFYRLVSSLNTLGCGEKISQKYDKQPVYL